MLKVVRHPPYQGGQGGSNLKFIFNLIITSYLIILTSPATTRIFYFYKRCSYVFINSSNYPSSDDSLSDVICLARRTKSTSG
ncbi:MAG: hypothetical protein DWQ51_16930 [Microcystis wesenbergii TW10]|uniref:Uncharacterized protein n=2 Tax=Microcystis TaxID=1125 RepID=A0A552AQY0_MICAE|nr:MAG: hypothetical protein DWQ51_16930 [Microcystis wesenbergii TW10]TRT87882.1 MAG: hypothetical protein EWV63_07455 [Microcystis aeruginosa Ma_OC_H_19870700_S124]